MPVGVESAIGAPLKLATPGTSSKASSGGNATGMQFAESLGRLIEGVEDSQTEANQAVTAMVNKTGEVHDAMIALQRAQMQLELTVTVRNKLVSAYQEIMRMPV
jgi:flagellar hook-basal body complex protein FliE